MTILLTITSKGQVTFSKKALKAMNLSIGDKIALQIEDNKEAVIKPLGRGMLDMLGTLPKFKIPKSKTIDDLIHEARNKEIEKEIYS